MRKKERKVRALAEMNTRWKDWLLGPGSILMECKLPPESLVDVAHFKDFVQHGTLHYFGPAVELNVHNLSSDQLVRLRAFIASLLDLEQQANSGLLYQIDDTIKNRDG